MAKKKAKVNKKAARSGRRGRAAKRAGKKSSVPRRAPRAARGGAAKKRPAPAEETYGAGSWNDDDREGLRQFSESPDAEELAREAAEELEEDFQDAEDEDLSEAGQRGSEEEPEW